MKALAADQHEEIVMEESLPLKKTYEKPSLEQLYSVAELTQASPANGAVWDGEFSGTAYDS